MMAHLLVIRCSPAEIAFNRTPYAPHKLFRASYTFARPHHAPPYSIAREPSFGTVIPNDVVHVHVLDLLRMFAVRRRRWQVIGDGHRREGRSSGDGEHRVRYLFPSSIVRSGFFCEIILVLADRGPGGVQRAWQCRGLLFVLEIQ